MEILLLLVVGALVLTVLSRLSGDGGRSYDEYRRMEYRNEYLWETRQHNTSRLYDQIVELRHP